VLSFKSRGCLCRSDLRAEFVLRVVRVVRDFQVDSYRVHLGHRTVLRLSLSIILPLAWGIDLPDDFYYSFHRF
jgi:hypothetical protein